MIKVNIKKDEITIKGHARYSEYGTDIVCASVSSIVGTIVNCIMNIDRDSIIYSDDGKVMTIKVIKDNSVVNTIISTMIELLKDLERQYKENIKVESEE